MFVIMAVCVTTNQEAVYVHQDSVEEVVRMVGLFNLYNEELWEGNGGKFGAIV